MNPPTKRGKGTSSVWLTPSLPHLSFLHARHQICTPVLYPLHPRLPYHDPTSIDCSTALLPYFYGFTPLPHPPSVSLRPPSPPSTSHITVVDAREGVRDASLPYRERVTFAGAQEVQEAHRCQAFARAGIASHPRISGRGGGGYSPSGAEIRIADMRFSTKYCIRVSYESKRKGERDRERERDSRGKCSASRS